MQLLEQALAGLESSGFGSKASVKELAFAQDWQLIQTPFAAIPAKLDVPAVDSKHGAPVKACDALSEFVSTVQREENEHHSKLSGSLGKQLIQQARAIEAQVGCGSLPHGRSSKHRHR